MDVTSRQVKQILQLIEDKGADSSYVQWLLGGFLSDLLDKNAKPSRFCRNMWKGLLGLEFQVEGRNTVTMTKTENGFRAIFGDVAAEGTSPEEALGILLIKISHSLGMGVRWDSDMLTKAYRQDNPKVFPDFLEIHVVSGYSDWAHKSFGPFNTDEDAIACLKKGGWQLNVNKKPEEAELWFGWPCSYTLINAVVRKMVFTVPDYLNPPDELPPTVLSLPR